MKALAHMQPAGWSMERLKRAGLQLMPGVLTRYMFFGYLQRFVVVMTSLVIIALSIDLAQNAGKVLAQNPSPETTGPLAHLAWYTLLRVVDILTRLLVVATFLAVLWWELRHTQTRERVSVWNTGAPPVQRLGAVLMLGCLLGAMQFSLETWLRPAVVMEQARTGLGTYGQRYDRREIDRFRWIQIGDQLMSARIDYGPPPALRNLTIYRLNEEGELFEIVKADHGYPVSERGDLWALREVRLWTQDHAARGRSHDTLRHQDGGGLRSTGLLDHHTIALDLDPLWLSYRGIAAKYLPQPVLSRLAAGHAQGYDTADYRTWLYARVASAFLPGLIALLAATVAMFSPARMPGINGFIGMFITGYLAHVLLKLFWVLGERGFSSHLVAAWFVPVTLAAGIAIMQLYAHRRIV